MIDQFSDLPLYIDSSMLTAFRACRRKFFWSTIHALYPTGRSVHLTAGAAFAAGMEAARKHAFSHATRPTTDQLVEAAFPAFAREWGSDFVAPDGAAKSFTNTFAALIDYLERFHPLHDVIQPHFRPDGSPAVEYTFSVPLDGPEYPRHPSGEPFIFVGRFDMLGYYGSDRLPVIVDEKTTGSIGFDWEAKWSLRGQFIGYVWALQQLGINIHHAAIRGIAILKTKNDIKTALPMYADHIVANWHLQLIRDLVEITETYREWKNRRNPAVLAEGQWDMNFADSCESYGGCAFATLCVAKRPEPFFTNYIRHRWNPLAKNPVTELYPAEPMGEERRAVAPIPQPRGDPQCETCLPAPLSEPCFAQPSPPMQSAAPLRAAT